MAKIDWDWMERIWNAPMRPQKLLMHADDFRDLLVYSFMEEGMSAEDAEAEANRRMDAMGTDEDSRV